MSCRCHVATVLHLVKYALFLLRAPLLTNEVATNNLSTYFGSDSLPYYFFQGEKFNIACYCKCEPALYITANGENVTDPSKPENYVITDVILNRSTEVTEYQCHLGNESKVIVRIPYVLCDPFRITPIKACPTGQFCTINKSGTSCQDQSKVNCARNSFHECKDGRAISLSRKGKCSKDISKGYYIEHKHGKNAPCSCEPLIYYNEQKIAFLSTIAIGSSYELNLLKRGKVTGCTVRTRMTIHGVLYWSTDEKNDVPSWEKITKLGLPSKVAVLVYSKNDTRGVSARLDFYILFYEKAKGPRFSVVQTDSNLSLDITRRTTVQKRFNVDKPFKCTGSIPGGLYIKVRSGETDAAKEPELGEASVDLRYKNCVKAAYACTASVYFYEFPPRSGFRLLYNRTRYFAVRCKTASAKCEIKTVTSKDQEDTGCSKTSKYWSTLRILIGVGLGALVVIGGLVAILVIVNCLRKKEPPKNNKSKDTGPAPFRSVRAPETDRFVSMTAEESAAIVTASHLQPSQGSGLTASPPNDSSPSAATATSSSIAKSGS